MTFNWPEVVTLLLGLLLHALYFSKRLGRWELKWDLMWIDYCKRKNLNGGAVVATVTSNLTETVGRDKEM